MTKIFEGSEEELRKNSFAMDKLGEAALKVNDSYQYFIGADSGDDVFNSSYCLARKNVLTGSFEIMALKIVKNKNDFENQVKVLAEVFNAKINRE